MAANSRKVSAHDHAIKYIFHGSLLFISSPISNECNIHFYSTHGSACAEGFGGPTCKYVYCIALDRAINYLLHGFFYVYHFKWVQYPFLRVRIRVLHCPRSCNKLYITRLLLCLLFQMSAISIFTALTAVLAQKASADPLANTCILMIASISPVSSATVMTATTTRVRHRSMYITL